MQTNKALSFKWTILVFIGLFSLQANAETITCSHDGKYDDGTRIETAYSYKLYLYRLKPFPIRWEGPVVTTSKECKFFIKKPANVPGYYKAVVVAVAEIESKKKQIKFITRPWWL